MEECRVFIRTCSAGSLRWIHKELLQATLSWERTVISQLWRWLMSRIWRRLSSLEAHIQGSLQLGCFLMGLQLTRTIMLVSLLTEYLMLQGNQSRTVLTAVIVEHLRWLRLWKKESLNSSHPLHNRSVLVYAYALDTSGMMNGTLTMIQSLTMKTTPLRYSTEITLESSITR